ncbi:hypothetical protein PilKf_02330 [Pillotina sp. SPG140]|jgi:uncharacterized protein (DUF1015 family)
MYTAAIVDSYEQRLQNLGLAVPELLIPVPSVDLSKWAVIACDQFTQQPEYWKRVAAYIGNSPSTLNMIIPERELQTIDLEARVETVQKTMIDYYNRALFTRHRGFVYVERTTPYHALRRGLIVLIDLEQYDWKTKQRISPTEQTLAERLPARIALRRNALLELSHVILFVDDRSNQLFSHLTLQKPLYQTKLGTPDSAAGTVTGWLVDEPRAMCALISVLERCAETNAVLYTVGDGNHSLASAKALWEEHKHAGITDSPARYALVELENIHDDGVHFESIHRVLFGVSCDTVLDAIKKSIPLDYQPVHTEKELLTAVAQSSNCIGILSDSRYIVGKLPSVQVVTAAIQPALDALRPAATIDYVHEKDTLLRISEHAVGILMPPISKHNFFDSISEYGVLPQKSFSVGEALEKRFYVECRTLINTGNA